MSQMRILISDDDEVDRMIIIRALEPLHAEVTQTATGTEALEKCRQQQFDCIIIDHLLPDYDSMQLIPEIRECASATPIIVVTGFGNELLAVKMLKAGAVDYIPKDKINAEVLSQAIREAVDDHRATSSSLNSLREISILAASRVACLDGQAAPAAS